MASVTIMHVGGGTAVVLGFGPCEVGGASDNPGVADDTAAWTAAPTDEAAAIEQVGGEAATVLGSRSCEVGGAGSSPLAEEAAAAAAAGGAEHSGKGAAAG